jgi:hypothetical protein
MKPCWAVTLLRMELISNLAFHTLSEMLDINSILTQLDH